MKAKKLKKRAVKKRVGRPPSGSEVFDSMAACASATGFPLAAIRKAKRAGCLAFQGGRVRLLPLVQWINDSNGATDAVDDKAENLRLQNEKLRLQLRQMAGELVPVDELEGWEAEVGGMVRSVVCQLHRLAPALEGLPVKQIEDQLKAAEDDVLSQLHAFAEKLEAWQETTAGREGDEDNGKGRKRKS